MKKKAKNKKQTKSRSKRITKSDVFNKAFLDGSISIKDFFQTFEAFLQGKHLKKKALIVKGKKLEVEQVYNYTLCTVYRHGKKWIVKLGDSRHRMVNRDGAYGVIKLSELLRNIMRMRPRGKAKAGERQSKKEKAPPSAL